MVKSDSPMTALDQVDAIVVGSGLAGLLTALELAGSETQVLLVCKGRLADSNTSYAQGGLAAVTAVAKQDSVDRHLDDTIKSGAGLTDPAIASLIIKEGAALINRLKELGVAFDHTPAGVPSLALEGGHSSPRVLHSKDTTGSAITQSLVEQVLRHRNIFVLENTMVVDLIVQEGSCVGIRLLAGSNLKPIFSPHVILATGGAGQIFERTTNPAVATADGIALAWRAGAMLADMEFVQFHPTALYKPNAPAFLISEAVRGAGAVLVDAKGKRFTRRFHPDGELSTRDVVARAINTVMLEQSLSCVWLDARPLGSKQLLSGFPNIVANCRRWGIDPVTEPIPVSPAAHYFMGGIWTNANGCTNIPGLYAVGECASVGLHGANRLASNSLLEAGVMALRLSRFIERQDAEISIFTVPPPINRDWQLPSLISDFRHIMYRYAGVERDEAGLTDLFEYISETATMRPATRVAEFEAANIFLVGQLIALSALCRQESRGAHWRSDYPQTDDEHFGHRQFISANDVAEKLSMLSLQPLPVN